MKKTPHIINLVACSAALSCAATAASAATLNYDSGAAAGVQAGSGTWDFNMTPNWTADNGGSRINWTNNADVAAFSLQGNAGTVTIDNTNGQVGAAGLVFSGATGSASNAWTLGAVDATAGIRLGAGGLTNQISDGLLVVNAPVALTASQTWTSTKLGLNNQAAGVRVNGAISSFSGATNLTFDGLGLSSAVRILNADNRVVFELAGNNTFTGTTTVTGGAALRLRYVEASGAKLHSGSALNLNGGSIVLDGGSGHTETVSSTNVGGGANSIYRGANGGSNVLALGALTNSNGGTLNVVGNMAATTTTNTNGILGGWATSNGNRFAVGSTNGASTVIGNIPGSTQNTYGSWVATTNTIISAAVSGDGNRTVNSLRLTNATTDGVTTTGTLTLTSGSTATIASGGIIGDSATAFISGGNITSGVSALYVHTPSNLTISSAIINNGGNAVALVKAGANTLTINGANTYTGPTYVNSGTLAMTGGSLANGNVFVRGAAVFTMNSSSAITFNINGADAGQFDVFTQDVGGSFTLGGTLNVNFTETFGGGGSFDLFNLASGSADGFNNISISGSYVGALTEGQNGIWSGTASGQTFTFTESTGILQLAAIPEPSTAAALFGAAALGLAALRRRRA